jgi:Zn-dependent peptidase ImmA (M78 family)/DNA-binding XRE family transcriptional regulator
MTTDDALGLSGPLAIRLRAAREARGLTQAQAAAELGVSRPLLIAIEKGTRQASPQELTRLAEIYRTTVSELLRPAPPPTAIGARFRAVLPADQRDGGELSLAVDELQRRADDYLDLLRITASEPPGRPEPVRAVRTADSRRAEDLATEERNRLGLGDGPVRPLREVLEIEVGLRVFLLPLPSRIAGLFVIAEPLGGCIAVNSRHPSERRRWTMAHEYAHYLANRDRAEVTRLAYQRQPESEYFADAFAASFLMPRSGLSRRFHELKRTSSDRVTPAMLVQLAHAYGVSLQALSDRLEELGLIPAGTWERLRERNFQPRMAARMLGLEQPEQASDALPLHYRLLAAQLYADGEITETQFARYLRTDIVGARRAYAELTETADVGSDGSPQILDLADATG